MRYAIVIDGKVDNVVEWDGITQYEPEPGELVKLHDQARVAAGWTYADGKFTEPESTQPEE